MKFRGGFVTNSSSSSFIIALDKLPKSIKEVKELLFDKDQTYYGSPYDERQKFSLDDVARSIFSDLKTETPKDKVIESMNGYWDEEPNFPRYEDYLKDSEKLTPKQRDAAWKKLAKDTNKFLEKKYIAFKKKHKNKFIIALEISDDDGAMYSAMEHGDLFKNVNHIRVSHH